MDTAKLMTDILELQETPGRLAKLEISPARQEEMFANALEDITPIELMLIRNFMNIYKIDFIERYQVPEHMMKIEYIEPFVISGKQLDEYFSNKNK